MGRIGVFIAEDHTLVREGTRQILEQQPDLAVVGEADRGDLAVERIARLRPDVALLDVRLPGLNGVAATARLRSEAPAVRALLLSAYDDAEYILAALQAGAAGYLLKTVPGQELVAAVRAVHAGETVLQEAVSRALAEHWRRAGLPDGGGRLSAREREVLSLLAGGLANKEIAARLGISLRTVEGHLGNVFGKLGVGSRTEALLYALKHRLLLEGGEDPAMSIGAPALARPRWGGAPAPAPPQRDGRLRAAQALALVIVLAYGATELAGARWPLGSQDFAPIALFAIPMAYATRGLPRRPAALANAAVLALAVGTAALLRLGPERLADSAQAALVGLVAVAVGQRVQHELLVRRRAEAAGAALAASEARYRALFEQSRAPILLAGADGLVREANAAAGLLFGAAGGLAPAGRPLASLVGPDLAARLLQGRPPDEVVLPAPSREELLLRPLCAGLADADGAPLLQVVLQDITEERRERRRLDAYAASVLRGQEEERRRISQELHDEPVQALIAVCRRLDALPGRQRLPAETLAALGQARDLVEATAGGLRELAQGLRPPSLDDLGLAAALRQLAGAFERRSGVAATLAVRGEGRLPPEVELALFRIAQEALRNVERHAAARHVALTLCFEAEVTLAVADDGRGFRPETAARPGERGRLGLLGMQERAAWLGGRLDIASAPTGGTTITAHFPTPVAPNIA